jgi:hypothetical protein
MTPHVTRGTHHAGHIFFKQTDCGIASVAEKTADLPTLVIVVDAKVLKERRFVSSTLCRHTQRPRLPTNCAAAPLFVQKLLHVIDVDSISSAQV